MDRSRRASHRRLPFGSSTSPKSDSASLSGFPQSPISPLTTHAITTNNTPRENGVAIFGNVMGQDFTFGSPSTTLRKRSRTLDDSGDDKGKGGHSLRKRVRVNYASEMIDDEVVVPNSTSSTSRLKRGLDASDEGEDFFGPEAKRRETTDAPDTPSSRRRNPSRKSAEMKAYAELLNEDDYEDSPTFEEFEHQSPAVDATDFASINGNDSPSARRTSRVAEKASEFDDSESFTRDDIYDNIDDPSQQLQEENLGAAIPSDIQLGPREAAPEHLDSSPQHIHVEDNPNDDGQALEETSPADNPINTTTTVLLHDNEQAIDPQLQLDTTPSAVVSEKAENEDGSTIENEIGTLAQPTPSEETMPSVEPQVPSEVNADIVPEEIASQAEKPSQPQKSSSRKPQPAPKGRFSYLTPFIEGQYSSYPEVIARIAEEEISSQEQTPAEKESDREGVELETTADENDDLLGVAETEVNTALNTPLPGSPAVESAELTASNSPAALLADSEEFEASERQESPTRQVHYKFPRLRDPEDYFTLLENPEKLTKEELYEVMEAVNLSLVAWQDEYNEQTMIVDDYENAQRRRVADEKYEEKTANLNASGVNHIQPVLEVKGYKAKQISQIGPKNYLQHQDRLQAQVYGFEYDPHPSKIGNQNPTRQRGEGKETRSRSLRNQPKPTAKAFEADEVSGKRQRKPIQTYELPVEPISRGSTPVPPVRVKRTRKNANPEPDASSFASNGDIDDYADTQATKPQRRRAARASQNGMVSEALDDFDSSQEQPAPVTYEVSPRQTGRRARAKPQTERNNFESEQQPKRLIVTLKIPRNMTFYEAASGFVNNSNSRPSTATSEASNQTVESNYSFRPKRQKRFREDPEDEDSTGQEPPKKRGKQEVMYEYADQARSTAPSTDSATPEASLGGPVSNVDRKPTKIRVKGPSQKSRNVTPSSQPSVGPGEAPKDYSAMTKSEKMSASMKSRWANGNMASAVAKRKQTLQLKKLAQAEEQKRLELLAPMPEGPLPNAMETPIPAPQVHAPMLVQPQMQVHPQPPLSTQFHIAGMPPHHVQQPRVQQTRIKFTTPWPYGQPSGD